MLNIINSIMYVLCVLVGYFLCYKFSNSRTEVQEKAKKEKKLITILKNKPNQEETEEEKKRREEFEKAWENINNYDGNESSQKG